MRRLSRMTFAISTYIPSMIKPSATEYSLPFFVPNMVVVSDKSIKFKVNRFK